ncbi:uncharacterized protein MYCFIDRAFT_82333 [Pseudocercospora fijiensis CIRAD86]|uniref:Clr5 domain-containing protein n=1 Tax=Pseudocercospora fijiensis (strain CIRAD86) TaxID=383855 RepID=M2ZTT2_PSEFD|nr:uncharacterized protein MYCFIDRAFT_82333 [Pseudocercospora fijiensis CIRAD86]EME82414.1 hypothetical protein MYCFIDRAFT_82333 [Pseudocercospora fijiensis CIRAD86]
MTKDWLSIKNEACQLYTLDEIKAELYGLHKFEASTRAWRLKFKEWGIKHRTANTTRIQKTATRNRRKVQVPDKHATDEPSARIGLNSPVLRYFKDEQVNADTEYLDDLNKAERWNLLAQEFVAHDYGDDVTSLYYEHLAELLDYYMYSKDIADQIRQNLDQLRKKPFWDIMRNRAKVLPALYNFLYHATGYFLNYDVSAVLFKPCVERNEFCAHSTECLSVASAILLHAKDQEVPGYWEVLGSQYESAELILRSWMSGDLRAPDKFLGHWCNNCDDGDIFCDGRLVSMVLEVIPDEYPEIKVKAMQVVGKSLHRLGLDLEYLYHNALFSTWTPLNWRPAEVLLQYSGTKPKLCLEWLSDKFNQYRNPDEHIDLTKPSLDIADTLQSILEDCLRVNHFSMSFRNYHVLWYFIHVITKAWVDLVLQDNTGSLELNASDILKIREDFGGLPGLRLSIDAIALTRMSNSADLQSLHPKLLDYESEPSSDTSQNGTNSGEEQVVEVHVISSDENESSDEDEEMPDASAPRLYYGALISYDGNA